MLLKRKQLHSGDRYIKQSPVAPAVWVVERLMEPPGLPRHVRLVRENAPLDAVTVSVYALLDERLYRPVAVEH